MRVFMVLVVKKALGCGCGEVRGRDEAGYDDGDGVKEIARCMKTPIRFCFGIQFFSRRKKNKKSINACARDHETTRYAPTQTNIHTRATKIAGRESVPAPSKQQRARTLNVTSSPQDNPEIDVKLTEHIN